MIAERLRLVRERIDAAAQRAKRDPDKVTLLAVTKTFPAERVVEAVLAGQLAFGENRVQEAGDKIPVVNERAADPLEWHLIGPLQRNKARRAVELFDVIQSLDRPELALALERACCELDQNLGVLLQVNIDSEEQKSGVRPKEAPDLLRTVLECPHLIPAGLMALPRACNDPEEVRPSFRRLRELLAELRSKEPRLVELSMGMSSDFEVAVEEGSTQVRVGSAIFGDRDKEGA